MDWLANLPWWQLLICGALLGWLVEWLIDIFYWRKQLGERDAKLINVNKEVSVLQSENTRINGDVKTMRADMNGLNTRLVARNQEYDDLSLRYEGVENDFNSTKLQLGEYETRTAELDGQLVELRDQSLGYENELKDLRVKYIARSKEVEERDGLLTGLRGQVGELETSLSGFHTQIGDKDQEISRLTGLLGGKDAEIEGKNTEIEGLNAQLASQVELVNENNARVGNIQSRLNTLEDENGNLRRTVADRNQTIDDLQSQIGSHEGEMDGIRSSLGIGAGAGILGAIGATMAAKQSESEAKETLNVRVGELETEIGALQGQVNALEEQKAALQAELSDANTQLVTYTETNEQLQSELKLSSGQSAEAAEMENWLGIYSQTTEQLQAEVAEKDAQLVEVQASLAAAQEVEDLQPQLDALSGRLNTLEVENSSLRKTLTTRNTLLDELRGDLNTGADGDLRGEVGGLLALRGAVSSLEQDVSGRDSQIGDLNAEVELLRSQLADQESTSVSTADDLRAQLEELQFRVNTLDVENAALRKSLLSAKLQKSDSSTLVTNFVPTQPDNSGDVTMLRGLVSDKDGEIDDLNVQLADAIEVSRARATNIDQLNDENADLRARLAAMESAPEPTTGDDFTVIHGIGPAFQGRLYDGGIMTYSDLCGSTPEAVEKACDPGVTLEEAANWIEDACTLAAGGTPADRTETVAVTGDDFTVIHGIGPAFQGRLYDGGIMTYSDLCGSTPEAVEKACDPGVTLEEAANWIEDACTLAAGGTPADRTVVEEEAPAPPPKPDNLTKIKGIGKVFQGRLYEGGIYTWEQLAGTDTERITAVIAPEEWQKLEPDSWRSQAAVLARKKRQTGGLMPDDLKVINGIGPVYEGRLNEAGIETFAALAASSVARIKEILDADELQTHQVEPSSWIAEAAGLAKKQ